MKVEFGLKRIKRNIIKSNRQFKADKCVLDVCFENLSKKHLVDTTCYHITASETLRICLGTIYLTKIEKILLKV